MSSPNVQRRRLVGLVLVLLVYAAGVIGWTWAVLTVEPVGPSGGTTAAEVRDGSSPSSRQCARWGQAVGITTLNGERRGLQ